MTTSAAHPILVVDDDPAILEPLADLLRLAGYVVLTAADGEEALRVLAAHSGRVGLVLLDLAMPGGMDGWTVYQHMRATPLLTTIPVVIHSAHPQDTPAGVPTLQKPATIELLLDIVRMYERR